MAAKFRKSAIHQHSQLIIQTQRNFARNDRAVDQALTCCMMSDGQITQKIVDVIQGRRLAQITGRSRMSRTPYQNPIDSLAVTELPFSAVAKRPESHWAGSLPEPAAQEPGLCPNVGPPSKARQ